MARFDVYAGLGAGDGYVVDVQAPLLDGLATRVVIPLLPAERVSVIRNLNPLVQIGDRTFVAMTQELAAVPRAALRQPIASVDHLRDDIIRALDVLFTGF